MTSTGTSTKKKAEKAPQDQPLEGLLVATPPVAAAPPVVDDQAKVVAAKFVGQETSRSRPRPRPTLPSTYGESHILLLARDPQTLFAAWDMSPSSVSALKSRIGGRAFAVSSLTLRLIRTGGLVTTYHVSKRARSRYLKIDGGSPSFIIEIGFSTPAGQFELVARSAPCAVPVGLNARQDWPGTARRAVLGYREARVIAKQSLAVHASAGGLLRGATRVVRSTQAGVARANHAGVARSNHAGVAPRPTGSSPSQRVLGGASDLYRR
ncbi:MAG: DUF4912 domain-containing protein [Vicinamibacteria bacterium]